MHLTLVSVCCLAILANAVGAAPPRAPSTSQAVREELCGTEHGAPADVARQLEPLGESGRAALLGLAASRNPAEAICGVSGLSALGDRRVIPHLAAALRNPAMRGRAHLLARWAAVLAGGPDADLGPAMLMVVQAITDQEVWKAAGLDAIWFLGEVDHPEARDRLLADLEQPSSDAGLDAAIHALARQGDPRARGRVAAVGLQAAREKSGNATPEQARRLGVVAFYQLALGPETMAEGIATLGTIATRDQEDAAAWAVHTLCERAVRRPSDEAASEAHRRALVEEIDRLRISWRQTRGNFGCAR